jgi:transposase
MHKVSTQIGGHLVMADDDQKLRVRLVGRNGRRRYETASKERLVAACLEPGVSVSRLALEHGVNANLLRKWIKKHTAIRSLPPSSPSSFIRVQLEGTADRALSRQDSVATVDLPATCDEVRGLEPKGAAFCSPAKVSASLPNGVKLALECGDVDALTAIIGALGHVQTGR